MKNVRNIVFATAILMAGAVASFAQTADELVSKHLKAIGGEEAWKKVSSVKMSGNINAQGMEMPMSWTVVCNKAMRMEFTVNGITGYQIVTDKAGWNYMPFGGQTKPEPMTAEQIKEMKSMLDVVPLVDYKAKGTKLTYLGKDDVEGTECQKLKLTFAGGKEQTWFFDKDYNHIRTIEKSTADGKENESTINYSNFKKLPEGVSMAMTMDLGDQGKLVFSTIEVNKKIDESVFKPSTN